jgi:hypothetical protein
MGLRVIFLTLLALLGVAAPAAAATAPATGRLLVSLEGQGDRAQAAALVVLARAAARRAGPSVPQIGLVTVRPSGGTSLRTLARRLRRDPAVRAVQVERRARPRHVPNDPALTETETAPGTPPGTAVQWWAQRLGLFGAWDTTRGQAALIAVIDSGVDGSHPELAGKVRGTIDADTTPGEGGPLVDEDGHGTHVASLACAASGDGLGLAGAGHDCGLLVAKTDFGDASVARAIVEATDRGAQVINLSFGTDGRASPPSRSSTRPARRTARGRPRRRRADRRPRSRATPQPSCSPPAPARDSSSLGCRSPRALRSRAASRARLPDLARRYGAFEARRGRAGCSRVAAARRRSTAAAAPPMVPPCRCRTTLPAATPGYAYLQGTSDGHGERQRRRRPLVVGLNPDLAPADVVRLLKQTARRPAGSGWNPELGWGIVDARTALETARRIDRRAPVSKLRGPRRARRGLIRLRWSATDESPPGVTASGVARYEVWRSIDGGRARRIRTTQATTMRTAVRSPGRVAFYTVAVDRAGNREQPPARADATVRVRRG